MSSRLSWASRMLEIRNVVAKYGAATALWDVSLDVAAGEPVCVVGPNGAGKTTLINVIAGLNRIAAGSLVLDGPSLGLAPAVVDAMFRIVRDVNAEGVSILLVEQNVAMALDIAHRAYVLEEGRIAAEGIPADLAAEPHIRRAYLGL